MLPLTEQTPGLGIHSASKNCDISSVKKYLAQGIDINIRDEYGMTPLFWALKAYPENSLCQVMVEFLLSKGADANAKDKRGLTPLHLSSINGNRDAAAILIKRGAKINNFSFQGISPLHLAVEKDQFSVAELLIENSAKIQARVGLRGLTPLCFAKSTEMVELLKKNGAKSRMYLWAEFISFTVSIFEKLVSYGLTW
jgi:ankyrin repeat protein